MNVTQRLIPLSDSAEWNDALSGIETGPAHALWYNEALSLASGDNCFLYYFRSDAGAVVVAPLCRRNFKGHADIYSPYGNGGFAQSGRIDDFWPAHQLFMMNEGIVCGHISLNQIDPSIDLLPPSAIEQLKPVFVVDTSLSAKQLWEKFGRNNRRHVKKWRATESVELIEDHETLLEAFLGLYPSFTERMGIVGRHRFGTDVLRKLLENRAKAKLFGVREASGEISIIRCFLFENKIAEAFMEASTPEGRRHSRIIYWHAFEWAHTRDIAKLNLSGGITSGDSLEFFKKTLGGDRQYLYRARLIYDLDQYETLCKQTDTSSALLPGAFFPPYRDPIMSKLDP